jgi:hypothetical protein
MENARFDHLVRVITAGHSSRRSLVTGLCTLALAGGSAAGVGLEVAAGRRNRHKRRKKGQGASQQTPLSCSGDSCDGTGGKRCGGRDDCQCYLAANGGNVCASSLQSSLAETCDTNKDCPRGHVCVEGGPACGGRGLRFCKAACYA